MHLNFHGNIHGSSRALGKGDDGWVPLLWTWLRAWRLTHPAGCYAHVPYFWARPVPWVGVEVQGEPRLDAGVLMELLPHSHALSSSFPCTGSDYGPQQCTGLPVPPDSSV